MTRMQNVIRLLAVLSAIWLTGWLDWQGHEAVPAEEPAAQTPTEVKAPQRQQRHEAVLTDATQLYRICSSRPQRLAPTQGSKTERTLNPCTSWARRFIVKPLQFLHDGRRRLESAPFCRAASRDYYVIALRHIIR